MDPVFLAWGSCLRYSLLLRSLVRVARYSKKTRFYCQCVSCKIFFIGHAGLLAHGLTGAALLKLKAAAALSGLFVLSGEFDLFLITHA